MLRDLPLGRYRNVGIMAHIDAGKTTVTERVLYFTGLTHRVGEVHHGTATTDWMPEEKKRGITITAAAVTTYWKPERGPSQGVEHRINLIDTPGHVDFTIEVERSLRVLDGAIAVFDAGHGVEAQSETVWRQADRYEVPRVAFINKMDKPGASFDKSVASMRERLGARALPVQLPLGEERAFRGVVDVVRCRAFAYAQQTDGVRYEETEVPAELEGPLVRARTALVEACAEWNESVLEQFVLEGPMGVAPALLSRALREGTLARAIVPVLCGTALENKGVQMLLDAVVDYLPAPDDVRALRGRDPRDGGDVTIAARDDAPLCALAFKLVADPFVGTLTYLRVYAGTLRAGDAVYNASRARSERVGRLLRMHANEREDVAAAHAGVIVAAVGLKHARTGETLCDERHPVVLESLAVPEPVLELAIEPKSRSDADKLSLALGRLTLEDPSVRVASDDATGQTLVRGMGELHLEVLLERLAREFGVSARAGAPRVAYRETLAGSASADYLHRRQSGGPGQYARVVLEVAPAERGAGLRFEDRTRGGVIAREFISSVEKGVAGAMQRGVLAGYPLVDARVTLLDGAMHATDSNALAFEIAGSLAFQQAARDAGVRLLEPLMAVSASAPEEALGAVLGDLMARRAQVRSIDARGDQRLVEALAPLAELFGYVGQVRGLTRGRGTASMQFASYEPVPEGCVAARLASAATR